MAPAAAFSDSEDNLKATFSFLNCTLHHQRLNQKEWAQLEQQVRDWAEAFGDMSVEVDVLFESNHPFCPQELMYLRALSNGFNFLMPARNASISLMKIHLTKTGVNLKLRATKAKTFRMRIPV